LRVNDEIGPIMSLHTFIWVSEQPPRTDKSALGAIYRALRFVAGVFL